MSERILFVTIITMCLGFGSVFYINHQKIGEIETLNSINKELMLELNIKDAELQTARNDLNEAHEVMGVLFLEAMLDRELFNELKKQKCKKGK